MNLDNCHNRCALPVARAQLVSLVVLCATLAACGATTPQPSAPRPDSLRSERVGSGVTYEYRWYAAGPWAVHAVTVDPRACGLDVRTVKGQDHVVGRETTTSMARRTAERLGRPVLVAVNADFFSFEPPGVPEGPQISNGVLIKSEGSHREAIEDRVVRLRPVFAFTSDKRGLVTHTRLRGSIRIGSLELPLAGVNVRARTNSAVVFTNAYGPATPVDTGAFELVVRDGLIQSIDTAAVGVTIPPDGFVVATMGTATSALASPSIGTTVTWHAEFDSVPGNVTELVGGYPMLLLRGQPVHHDEPGLRAAFSDRRHPRVAVGIDARGRIHIVAVDGRQEGYSVGMSLQELGDYLLAHGIRNALNLDGGGSTTVVIADRIVNRPSDAAGERPVANGLAVVGPAPGTCR